MKSISEIVKERPWIPWFIFGGTMLVVFFLGLFLSSVMERRVEALVVYSGTDKIATWESSNEKWAEFFPREYNTWAKTKNMDFKSKYNGNMLVDALKDDPKLVVLWAGYGFAKDYNQPRGHYHAIEDIRNTLRTGAPVNNENNTQPNTCWTCKSPDVPRIMNEIGVEAFYKGGWSTRGADVVNSIGCADCHEPKTMNHRISRPGLTEALERRKEKIEDKSFQDIRSLVCAQCHVEYYFKGEGKYLTLPWDKGMTVEEIEAYYDEIQFSDWTHSLSKAPMLKAQHPDYEIFKTGIHGQRGLACADCHTPYVSEGGIKYTNHQVVSPLKNISSTCQVCHRETEETLRNNVYERQDKCFQLRTKAEDLIVKAHIEAKKAWDLGATEEEMKPALTSIRHAQWRWDFAAASHGASFHAPLEVARILSGAIDKAYEARMALEKVMQAHGFTAEAEMPDISTKEKAQAFIGLNMDKLRQEKETFLKTEVVKWDDKSKK